MMVYELTLRLATALVVGVIIGIERQWRHKMPGLRTNVLVAVGAAMFCLIAALSAHEASPTRIVAQIASGTGFLGAGVILRDGLNIRGLNTAATLWCAAAAGAMAGSGFPVPAVAARCPFRKSYASIFWRRQGVKSGALSCHVYKPRHDLRYSSASLS